MTSDPVITRLGPRGAEAIAGCEALVQPGEAATVALRAHDRVTVVNVYGQQVVDCWAHGLDPRERSSMEHTRVHSRKLRPTVGHTFLSNSRNPMFTLVEDTSGGHHDTLLAACDPQRYALLGHDGYHANCSDNYRIAMRASGVHVQDVPSPLNLFEKVSIDSSGSLSIVAPSAAAGTLCTLQAEAPITVILSVCPQDLVPTNGEDMQPTPVLVRAGRADPDCRPGRTAALVPRRDP